MQFSDNSAKIIDRVHNRIINGYSKALSEIGISYTQATVCCVLAEAPNQQMTQRSLRQHLGVANATLSGVLKRMVKRKLICQAELETDSRVKVITLTSEAKELYPSILSCMDKVTEKIYAGFSQDEKEYLLSLLFKVQANLQS